MIKSVSDWHVMSWSSQTYTYTHTLTCVSWSSQCHDHHMCAMTHSYVCRDPDSLVCTTTHSWVMIKSDTCMSHVQHQSEVIPIRIPIVKHKRSQRFDVSCSARKNYINKRKNPPKEAYPRLCSRHFRFTSKNIWTCDKVTGAECVTFCLECRLACNITSEVKCDPTS